jgi:hypothetical protein
MPLSAYDRWKTSAPPYRPQGGDCLQCGAPTEWVTGRALMGRKLLQAPKPLRAEALASLRARLAATESYCAYCGSEAIHAKFVSCGCGAETAWRCLCP